eukprot:9494858-Pyramimonas_sp.AAC.1
MLREQGTRTERHLAARARYTLGARAAAPGMHPAPLAMVQLYKYSVLWGCLRRNQRVQNCT